MFNQLVSQMWATHYALIISVVIASYINTRDSLFLTFHASVFTSWHPSLSQAWWSKLFLQSLALLQETELTDLLLRRYRSSLVLLLVRSRDPHKPPFVRAECFIVFGWAQAPLSPFFQSCSNVRSSLTPREASYPQFELLRASIFPIDLSGACPKPLSVDLLSFASKNGS